MGIDPLPESPAPDPSAGPVVFVADLALVRAAAEGRAPHLDELAARCACLPRIVRALDTRMGGGLQEQDVLDIAQDALVRAWLKLGEYAGEARLEAWLYGIARYEVLNALRRRGRRIPADVELDALPDRTAPEAVEPARFDYEVLHAGLRHLDPRSALVVRLKHFEDLTFEEIGGRLGISPNTAKTRYYRGLTGLEARLRSRLGEEVDA